MSPKTWELIVEPKKPIPISDLELVVHEGDSLNFPIHRAFESNAVNSHWSNFVQDMTKAYEKDIFDAIKNGNKQELGRIMRQVAGINSMYRLNDATLEGNRLVIDMGVTNFKDYIGTSQRALLDPEFRKILMAAGVTDHNNPNHYFSNPLATCSSIVTSDGFILVGTRSEKVAIYPGVPHVTGGYVKVNGDNRPDFTVKDVDLFSNMRKELYEELGLTDEDVTSKDFLGIVRNLITRAPEALYNISLNINSDELHHRWKTKSRDRFEHRNITFYSRDELPGFLRKNEGTMVPTGEATLKLFLQHYA